MALLFEKHNLEKLRFVCQTGGNNPKVKWNVTGIESMAFGAMVFGRLKITPKGIVHVFGEDDSYRGYIRLGETGIPVKHKPDPIDEGTTFKDWYTTAE